MIADQIVEEAFTPELITKNESLKGLTPDQINDLVTLGNNTVKERIRLKTADFYNSIDKDVQEASGLEKGTNERTYDFVKRAIKSGSKELAGQLASLKSEKDALEAQVKSGNVGDAVKKQIADLESKIKDKESEVTQWKEKHTKDLTEKETALQEAQGKNMKIRVDFQFADSLSGLKFLDEAMLPKVARDATINAAKISVLAQFKPEFIDDGNGNEKMVWKNDKGEIARNPENKLEPFTTVELLSKELAPILDKGRTATGSGSKSPQGATTGGQLLISASTQVEADEQIVQHLMSNAIQRGTKAFDDQFKKIREDNKISSLPIK